MNPLRDRIIVFLLTFLATSLQAIATQPVIAEKQPNIIFILCDDLGWGDLGVLHQNASTRNRKFATPQLDAMANEGAQLRNHYCPAPVCAPSRASLLLGVHQGHSGVRDNQFDKELPHNHTLATVLQSAGYQTAIVGKYGLQGSAKRQGQQAANVSERPATWPGYPTQRGFDEFFGYVRHVDGHLHYPAENWPLGNSPQHCTPKEVWHNDREISQQLDLCYTTDLFTAYAKKWIVQQTKDQSEKPFFLYLAYDTPHAALQVPSTAYPDGGGLDGGVQWLGKEHEMINTARGEVDSYRYPEHTGKGWSDVEERFATMVKRIDDCVGDLLQTLRDLNIEQNTLVVLSSDNGPHHEAYLKAAQYDPTSFQSYGPFDGTKRDTWEGGIRVPTLAWWPTKIPAGTIDTTPGQFHDWMATLAEVAGTHPPAICDGVSLLPTMMGGKERRDSRVYVEYAVGGATNAYDDFQPRKRKQKRGQMQVLMMDGYKGIRVDIMDPRSAFEIYDLEQDPSELHNLADTSDKFHELQERMQSQVLRMRRSNSSAPRPYDELPVPSLSPQPMQPGMIVSHVKGEFNHVPLFESLKDPQVLIITKAPQTPLDLGEGAYRYIGYLDVPADDTYEFNLKSSTRAIVRIHDAVLIDNDFHHDATNTVSTKIHLASGLHRFTITMLSGEMPPQWKLSGYASNDQSTDIVAWDWLIPKSRDE